MLSCVRGICLVSVLSSLAVTFLLSISFALFLKHRYVCVCVHTYMYTENCKHDKHEECHYHFSETQLIREWELLYYIIYVCVKSIMSQKSDDDAHHVSCLQFSLFRSVTFFVIKRYLQIVLKMILLYCKLFIISNAFAGSSGTSP